MKKSHILLWSVLFCIGTVTHAQVPIVEFHIQKHTFKAGETVHVPILVNNFKEICAFQWGIAWDPGVLGFKDVQSTTIPGFSKEDWNVPTNGLFLVSWLTPVAFADGANIPDGGVLMTLTFTAYKSGQIEYSLKPVEETGTFAPGVWSCGGNPLKTRQIAFYLDIIKITPPLEPDKELKNFTGDTPGNTPVAFQVTPSGITIRADKNDGAVLVELLDLQGRIIVRKHMEDSVLQLDKSAWANSSGVLILRMSGERGVKTTLIPMN
jgi:hypothetical protein